MDNIVNENNSNQYFASCYVKADKTVLLNTLLWGTAKARKSLGVAGVICLAMLILLIGFGIESAVLISIWMFAALFCIIRFCFHKKIIEKTIDKFIKTKKPVCSTLFFFDDHFVIESQHENETSSILVSYDKIKDCCEQYGYLYFTFVREGEKKLMASYLDVSALQGDKERVFSIFANRKVLKHEVRESKNQNKKIKAMLLALFIASVFSIFAALMSVGYAVSISPLPDFVGTMPEKMWLLLLFLPIPVSSVILGIVFCKKGYKAKKNIIAGVIMSILLALYGGMFSSLPVEHDFAFLAEIETVTSMQLPDDGYISVLRADETNPETQALARFYDEQKTQFENSIIADDRWKDNIADFYAGVDLRYQLFTQDYDWFCFYDVQKSTFNACSSQPDSFVFMAYDIEDGLLYIIYV